MFLRILKGQLPCSPHSPEGPNISHSGVPSLSRSSCQAVKAFSVQVLLMAFRSSKVLASQTKGLSLIQSEMDFAGVWAQALENNGKIKPNTNNNKKENFLIR